MARKNAIIEGLLFIAGDEGLTLEQLSHALDISQTEVEPVLEDMGQHYQQDEDSGIELVHYGGRFKLVSKPETAQFARKLFTDQNSADHYSPAALETLAIIAYKQPITRTGIEAIRGVSSDMIIRKLCARGLIRECGRTDGPGRPILYEVTGNFLDSFKLDSLKELPKLPDFSSVAEEKDLFE